MSLSRYTVYSPLSQWIATRTQSVSLKWYEGYDFVADFEGTLAIAEEFNEQYQTKDHSELFDSSFVRIGEESGDVVTEYQGDGWELFDAVTEIHGTLTTPFEEKVS